MYSPRLGFAYRPKLKIFKDTVIRGGYGINFNTGQYSSFACQLSAQVPFALTQTNIKRLLAYSSIAQVGYILLGLVAQAPAQLVRMWAMELSRRVRSKAPIELSPDEILALLRSRRCTRKERFSQNRTWTRCPLNGMPSLPLGSV